MDEFRKEEREKKQKIIAMALLPLSVGFCVWRLSSNPKAAQPKVDTPAVQQEVVTREVTAKSPLAQVKLVAVPAVARDPFVPAIAVENQNQAPKPVETAVNITEKPMPMLRLPNITSEPPPTLNTFPAIRPTIIDPPDAPSVEPAEPVMPYVLTGVVQGDPDVAILRHTDGSRRVVRSGDALDPSYRMVSIAETTVIVAGNGDTFQLKLGGGS